MFLIAQRKRPVALNATQKTPALYKVRFLKKFKKKTLINIPIFNQNSQKMVVFWGGFS